MQKPKKEYPLKLSSKELIDVNNLVLIGKIIGVHGIKGILVVYPYTESSLIYDSFDKLIVDLKGTSRLEEITLLWSKPYKNLIRVCSKNINDRDTAELFVNSKIYVYKSVLPELEEGTYYHYDLINIYVQSVSGEKIGYLKYIISTGSNDVYAIKRDNTNNSEILIPAIKSVIIDIDLINKLMIIDMPDGLE